MVEQASVVGSSRRSGNQPRLTTGQALRRIPSSRLPPTRATDNASHSCRHALGDWRCSAGCPRSPVGGALEGFGALGQRSGSSGSASSSTGWQRRLEVPAQTPHGDDRCRATRLRPDDRGVVLDRPATDPRRWQTLAGPATGESSRTLCSFGLRSGMSSLGTPRRTSPGPSEMDGTTSPIVLDEVPFLPPPVRYLDGRLPGRLRCVRVKGCTCLGRGCVSL